MTRFSGVLASHPEVSMTTEETDDFLSGRWVARLATIGRDGWACGIVYALGTVNFLWDKSQTPHMRADELCKLFDVSPATGSAKAMTIRKMFDMFQMDPRWSLPSKMDQNPLVWMLQVNGFIVDIRQMPREAQVIAFEKGFIPYIPADRK